MTNIEKIDDELYKSLYVYPRIGNYNEIWHKIRSNSEILREAVKIKKDKFGERNIVKGLTISEAILIDYENGDKVAYSNLINSIYTDTDIARIVINGASNGGFSFLLMSLWNYNLKLTKEQKLFAVNEAMNKIGTTRWKQKQEKTSKKLDDMKISDDNTVIINIGGCINPIGQKTGTEYMNYMFDILSTKQAHGIGAFDIRYHILKNPNWTLEEKEKLIMEFWSEDEIYDEYLEQWEWSIINEYTTDNGNLLLDKNYLYYYQYETLLNIYGDKKVTDTIWNEIEFLRQMHKLRPQQWELEQCCKKYIK